MGDPGRPRLITIGHDAHGHAIVASPEAIERMGLGASLPTGPDIVEAYIDALDELEATKAHAGLLVARVAELEDAIVRALAVIDPRPGRVAAVRRILIGATESTGQAFDRHGNAGRLVGNEMDPALRQQPGSVAHPSNASLPGEHDGR